MAYSKKTWITGDVITAADMNRIEDGVNSSQSMYNFKGKCTYAELPVEGNNVNDTWYVKDRKTSYTWNGTEWCETGDSGMSLDVVEAEIERITDPMNETIDAHNDAIENLKRASDDLNAFCRKEVKHEYIFTVPVVVNKGSSTKSCNVSIPAGKKISLTVTDPDNLLKSDATVKVYGPNGSVLMEGRANQEYTAKHASAVASLTLLVIGSDVSEDGRVNLKVSWTETTSNSLEEQLELAKLDILQNHGYIQGVQNQVNYTLEKLDSLKPFEYKGDCLSFQLPDLADVPDGSVYRVTDEFVTDDTYLVGSGVSVSAGTNVVKVTTDLKAYTPVNIGSGESGSVVDETCTGDESETSGASGYCCYSVDLSKLDKTSKYRLISYRPEAGTAVTGNEIPGYVIGSYGSDSGVYTIVTCEKNTDASQNGKPYAAELTFAPDASWLFINVKGNVTPKLEKITEGTTAPRWNILGGNGGSQSSGSGNTVYVGSKEPTDENVVLWLDPNGEGDEPLEGTNLTKVSSLGLTQVKSIEEVE